MKYSAVVVDDERLARQELKCLLADFDNIDVVGEAKNIEEAVAIIESTHPDIVFLDIQLRNKTGFDLLPRVKQDFKLIFVTAFDAYAIRAFEVNALDYLLKPVNPKRLKMAIKKLSETGSSDSTGSQIDHLLPLKLDDKLLLNLGSHSTFIELNDISHICASGDYTEVFVKDALSYSSMLVEKPMIEWQQCLPEQAFVRIHRSTIVNINQVESIETCSNRTMLVYLFDRPNPFQVSRRFASKLKKNYQA